MTADPNAHIDAIVLDLIEQSPTGAVPNTPTHQDALTRLQAAKQVFPHADHKDGQVTARSMAALPRFVAANLGELAAGKIDPPALESNASIFTRYVESLPEALRERAETHRRTIATRPAHHRDKTHAAHDPLHSLFLVPGTGPHHGLPGNYLHGAILEPDPESTPALWSVQLYDCDDGAAILDVASLAAAVEAVTEVAECAPFHLEELAVLGFRMN